MRLFNKFLSLALATVFMATGLYAQTVSTVMPTDTIGREVQKKINMLPYYEVFDYINYSIDGDTVTLSGKVLNGTNKSAAAAAVKRIPGVANVVNEIEVLPAGSMDNTIRRDLYRSLSNMGGLSRYLWPSDPSIRLVVERGRVTLEGYVANQTDLNLANMAARSVSGVFEVTNNLVVDKNKAG